MLIIFLNSSRSYKNAKVQWTFLILKKKKGPLKDSAFKSRYTLVKRNWKMLSHSDRFEFCSFRFLFIIIFCAIIIRLLFSSYNVYALKIYCLNFLSLSISLSWKKKKKYSCSFSCAVFGSGKAYSSTAARRISWKSIFPSSRW